MSLLDLIGNTQNSSTFGQGLENYFGNNTAMGQDINQVNNLYQGAAGKPKKQLIGQPASITNPAMQYTKPPSRSDILQKIINNQSGGDNTNIQDVPQPQNQGLPPLIGAPSLGKMGGSGAGAALGALLI